MSNMTRLLMTTLPSTDDKQWVNYGFLDEWTKLAESSEYFFVCFQWDSIEKWHLHNTFEVLLGQKWKWEWMRELERKKRKLYSWPYSQDIFQNFMCHSVIYVLFIGIDLHILLWIMFYCWWRVSALAHNQMQMRARGSQFYLCTNECIACVHVKNGYKISIIGKYLEWQQPR